MSYFSDVKPYQECGVDLYAVHLRSWDPEEGPQREYVLLGFQSAEEAREVANFWNTGGHKMLRMVCNSTIKLGAEERVPDADDPDPGVEKDGISRAGYHQFCDPDGFKYGSFEVFHCGAHCDEHEHGSASCHECAMNSGWYWWSCYPGCMPDGDMEGPFSTSEAAYNNAMEG